MILPSASFKIIDRPSGRGVRFHPSLPSRTLLSTPDSILDLVCPACHRNLGRVKNFGTPDYAVVRIPCPCGGSVERVALAVLYAVEQAHELPPEYLQREIQRALDKPRMPRAPVAGAALETKENRSVSRQ